MTPCKVCLFAVLIAAVLVMSPHRAKADEGQIVPAAELARVRNVLIDCPKKPTALECRQCCSDTLDDAIHARCIARCNVTY